MWDEAAFDDCLIGVERLVDALLTGVVVGAPCSIGNVGGNDGAWRTNVIQTLSA